MNFKKGQKVFWNDPGIYDYDKEDRPFVLSRVFEIQEVDNRNGTATIFCEETCSEAEVYTDELELI